MTMVILCDTREQANDHIIGYLKKKEVPYQSKALSFGDYSAMIPADPDMGIMRDLFFDRSCVIERKGSLEELSGNLTNGRERFKDELTRASKAEFHLMIEGKSFSDIINHRYTTQFNEKAYMASLLSLQSEHGFNLTFIDRNDAGKYIHLFLYYHVRNKFLKG
ncbi:ERCC4 domain-containing protein [Acetobacterium sp. UBA5834]|uniref:ERCC4 domain-containing protein n=1 Tax=Acetobacterium sp. UBA5834 TaxID=1945907 RepID=UPI00257D98C5|nr:ERCC4 domain-containing protein [Acetobacterium sp. UBA5834]